jgi:hypothetical protein
MRWKSWVGPKRGDKRAIKYFALWPAKLSNGFTVWLESYWSEDEWATDPDGHMGYWKSIRTWPVDNS